MGKIIREKLTARIENWENTQYKSYYKNINGKDEEFKQYTINVKVHVIENGILKILTGGMKNKEPYGGETRVNHAIHVVKNLQDTYWKRLRTPNPTTIKILDFLKTPIRDGRTPLLNVITEMRQHMETMR